MIVEHLTKPVFACRNWVSTTSMFLTVLALMSAVGCTPAQEPGDANVVSHGQTVEPGALLSFPVDHGAHDDYGLEWWYLTATVKDEQGDTHGAQFTLFRFLGPQQHQSQWWQGQWYMAHAMWEHKDSHIAKERYGRGVSQAGVQPEPFAVWLDDWRLQSVSEQFLPLQLTVNTDQFGLSLFLDDSPMLLHGNQGYSDKSGDGKLASYYYSYPRLQATGTITTKQEQFSVEGTAWLDREWSSALLDHRFEGWDWFGINLDDGSNLMLFCLRANEDYESHCDGTLQLPNGDVDNLEGQFTMTPEKVVEVDGKSFPTQWRIAIPTHNVAIAVVTNSQDQLNRLATSYWEGPVTVSGTHQGYGFIEMTGRDQRFQ